MILEMAINLLKEKTQLVRQHQSYIQIIIIHCDLLLKMCMNEEKKYSMWKSCPPDWLCWTAENCLVKNTQCIKMLKMECNQIYKKSLETRSFSSRFIYDNMCLWHSKMSILVWNPHLFHNLLNQRYYMSQT